MKYFLIALAALLFGALMAPAAEARGQYQGYWYGAQTPQELAGHVEEALARDSTGRTMLDAAKCRRDGSCAAPVNYLESLQAHDPHGGWTLENMASKMRSLRLDCDVDGVFQMDRIIWTSGSLGRTDVGGMSRAFLEGECAWVNPETGRPVLAEDCANPVGQRIDLNCVYVNFEVRNPEEYSVIWARYNRPDDQCFMYRRTNALFERDTPQTVWHQVPHGCIGYPCDLSQVNGVLGRQNVAQGQIPLRPGTYQIRLSPDELVVLCLKLRTTRGVTSSFASGVRWQQDYQIVHGNHHARVFYESNELREANLRFSEPRGLVFWASNASDEAAMRAGR